MKHQSFFAAALGVLAFYSMPHLNAASVTLGGPLPTARTATLASAQAGAGNSGTGSGNATAAVVSSLFGAPYTERGDVAGGSGGPGSYANGLLTVQVLTGSWGSKGPLTGNWAISAPFWASYPNAAISMHVGNGGGEPDHFIWKITPGAQTGTWSYNGTGLGGGGLSNLKLYSNGTGPPPPPPGVPDGGTTLVSLGIALLGLGSMRRLFATKA